MIRFYFFRNTNNKRSFDVAFLAGTEGNGSNEKIVLDKTCDETRKSAFEKNDSNESSLNTSTLKVHLDSTIPKSAFKKVLKQQSALEGVQKDDKVKGIVECESLTTNDLSRPIKVMGNKSSDSGENNNRPIHGKNDDLNYLIGPKGDTPNLEIKVIKMFDMLLFMSY